VPGPQGETGAQGPAGPQGIPGPQGPPGSSDLAGKRCGTGVLRGFDTAGELVCEATADLFPKLALCGVSGRDVSDFVTPGSFLVLAETCTPGPGIQAMLVARDGHAQLDADAVRTYLNEGGIIITAIGTSFPVYNKVFGESFVQPTTTVGMCGDNVNPLVQMNDGDPFWQSNPFVQESVGGCGFNLFDLPGITWLGGATEDGMTVTLAYAKVGEGRLWLAESDWSDGDGTFSAQSTRLMRYMVRTK
jgi:hypothetical protein